MKLEVGDILLIRGDGIISELIEEVSGSIYSHCCIYVGDGMIVEAEGFEKTKKIPISKYQGMADVYRYRNLTDEQKNGVVEFLNSQLNSKYDYVLLAVEFVRYVFHVTLPYSEPFHSHICSTLVNDTYKFINIALSKLKFPSPGDLPTNKNLKMIGSI